MADVPALAFERSILGRHSDRSDPPSGQANSPGHAGVGGGLNPTAPWGRRPPSDRFAIFGNDTYRVLPVQSVIVRHLPTGCPSSFLNADAGGGPRRPEVASRHGQAQKARDGSPPWNEGNDGPKRTPASPQGRSWIVISRLRRLKVASGPVGILDFATSLPMGRTVVASRGGTLHGEVDT